MTPGKERKESRQRKEKEVGEELLTKYDEYRLFLARMFSFPISDHVIIPKENCFFQMSSYARASTYICMHNL